jgi:hypothetical protein
MTVRCAADSLLALNLQPIIKKTASRWEAVFFEQDSLKRAFVYRREETFSQIQIASQHTKRKTESRTLLQLPDPIIKTWFFFPDKLLKL